VCEAHEGPGRPQLVDPLPSSPRPAGALQRLGSTAVLPSGPGGSLGLAGAHDHHGPARLRQVDVLQPAHTRCALPRTPAPERCTLPDQGAGPGQARALGGRPDQRVRPAIYDGDTPREARARSGGTRTWCSPTRTCSTSASANHAAWAICSPTSPYVVSRGAVYRGVFGSHVPTCCAGAADRGRRTAPSRASC